MRAFGRMMMVVVGSLSLMGCGGDDAGKTGGGQANSALARVTADDITAGNPNATVTLIEYASLGCSHCAEFNNGTLDALKAKYVATGKVRYVMREYMTGEPTLAVAGALLARCAGKEKYLGVVDAIYRAWPEFSASGIREPLLRVAQSAGLDQAQFEKCVSDEDQRKAFERRVANYAKRDKISGTPALFINGVLLDPPAPPENRLPTLPEIEAAIDAALAGRHPNEALVAYAKAHPL